MKFIILASGSKGNSTLIVSETTKILVDCGITPFQLKKVLEKCKDYGVNGIEDIDYVFVTHNHIDHTKSLNLFDKRKVYSGKKGYKVENPNRLEDYETTPFNDINVTPITLSHDVVCYGYIFEIQDKKLVYVTDTGYLSKKNELLIKDADYYIIESNHDIKMLMNSERTNYLKQRILSDYGHLSNRDCAIALTKIIGNKTKEIYLAHISEEANTEELALKTVINLLKEKNIDITNIIITSAKQWEITVGGHND